MENFQGDIKKWVSLDNQIKSMNDKIKNMRDEKNSTEESILEYIEECLLKCISNEEQVKGVMKVIKDSREYKYTPDIKRYTNN